MLWGHKALPHFPGSTSFPGRALVPSSSSDTPWHSHAQPRGVLGRRDTLPVPPWAVMSHSTRNSSVQDYFPFLLGCYFREWG